MKRSPLKRRTRLRSVSKKRAAENRVRREVVERHFGTDPRCMALEQPRTFHTVRGGRGFGRTALHQALRELREGCTGKADDAHEILPRGRGGSITDPDNILPVCRSCHDWIGKYPAYAQLLGLLRSAHDGSTLETPPHKEDA